MDKFAWKTLFCLQLEVHLKVTSRAYPLSLTRSGPSMRATSASIDRFVRFDIKHLMPHCLCWNVRARATIQSDVWMTIARETPIKIFSIVSMRVRHDGSDTWKRSSMAVHPFKARQELLIFFLNLAPWPFCEEHIGRTCIQQPRVRILGVIFCHYCLV